LVLGSSVRIEAGAVVRVPGGGEGRVVGWVRRFAGRVLPVSLLRVNYSAEAPPAGSPLLGADGRVVAIGYQVDPQRTGTGFALPVEVCQRVLADLDQDGRVVRAWLGLTLKEGMAIPAVVRVDEESPAGRGGLQAGDVLLQVGAYPVNEYAEAVNAFYFLTGGRPVKVRILRGVEVLDLTLVPQALPAGAGRPEVRR
jgi:serine protease Do